MTDDEFWKTLSEHRQKIADDTKRMKRYTMIIMICTFLIAASQILSFIARSTGK